jgi:hypothetical protein
MSTPEPSDLELRLLPYSPDARLFVELSSYQADLGEARTALELALAGAGQQGPLGDAVKILIGYAAIAYCRTYFVSKVRAPMTDHVSIPEEHSTLHAHITDYRNKRVAHSQSQLSATFAFIGLDADGSIRPGVIGMTAAQEIPGSLIAPWLALIDLLSDQVGDLQAEVESRIVKDVAAKDIDEVRGWSMWPTLEERYDVDFTAKTSRGRYPTGLVLYWSRTDQPEETIGD